MHHIPERVLHLLRTIEQIRDSNLDGMEELSGFGSQVLRNESRELVRLDREKVDGIGCFAEAGGVEKLEFVGLGDGVVAAFGCLLGAAAVPGFARLWGLGPR